VAAVEQITPGSSDVTAQAMRVKESKADIVLLLGGSIPDLANYVKTHKTLGNPAPMLGDYLYTIPAFLRLTGSASDGFIYTDSVDPTRPEVKEIEDRLVKKLGDRFRQYSIFNPRMGVHASVSGCNQACRSDDREAIRSAMEQTKNWPTALGTPGTAVTYSPLKHDFV